MTWCRLTRRRDHGSAVAEFVMVAGLVVVLGMGVFQLGLVLYTRNILVASAQEGARLGARADAGPAQAEARTRSLITGSLSAAYAEQVQATRTRLPDGVVVVEVTVQAPTPVIGLLGPTGSMSVTGRAFDEQQVLGR